ncbi:Fes1-domain-containing protein [Biscogniauxia mediterranea]|nr:Fes1-domain-containing protein [Biscogniauxia mediterranea]
MADKNLNELLKWGIENSTNGTSADAPSSAPSRPLNAEALAALMGAPSDAELMQAAMSCITSPDPEVTPEARLTAFDNFEQLVESLDNANLLERLGLWTPLLSCLAHPSDADLRRMAAWCIGTAVQNNAPCQERLVALGGIEKLVRMVLGLREEPAAAAAENTDGAGEEQEEEEKKNVNVDANVNGAEEHRKEGEEEDPEVRRKALYALSSAVRNYQPAMDACAAELRRKGEDVPSQVDATDMDAVNAVINGLKNKVATTTTSA